ncbi:MAG TPA: hypothetical protein DCZ72_01785 [Armatimonadetes bacterium]|nr:hypothetical protein [Armatimonadota bacterium]
MKRLLAALVLGFVLGLAVPRPAADGVTLRYSEDSRWIEVWARGELRGEYGPEDGVYYEALGEAVGLGGDGEK